jgi:hypothetical protein
MEHVFSRCKGSHSHHVVIADDRELEIKRILIAFTGLLFI